MRGTALIVDDSNSMRQMVAFTLKEAGFQVIEAENGKDALAKAPGSVNLVVTDLNMPEMDGITLIRELRTRPTYRYTPILMLTTESGGNRKQEGKEAGATGWIVKPFDPQKLLQVLDRVLA